MSFGEKIKSLRLELGLTLEEVGQIVGVGKSTVRKWESGEIANMRRDKIALLAKALHVDPAVLMGWDSKAKPATASASPAKPIRIPVLGSIPAGIPIEAVEDILDWEELPTSMGKGGAQYFALQVKGDSMSPNYLDGDVLILRRQDTCNSGQDCAVMVNGDDATFKRVKISDRGITLQPLNPAYDPLYFTHKECAEIPVRIIGVVVELRRKI